MIVFLYLKGCFLKGEGGQMRRAGKGRSVVVRYLAAVPKDSAGIKNGLPFARLQIEPARLGRMQSAYPRLNQKSLRRLVECLNALDRADIESDVRKEFFNEAFFLKMTGRRVKP